MQIRRCGLSPFEKNKGYHLYETNLSLNLQCNIFGLVASAIIRKGKKVDKKL